MLRDYPPHSALDFVEDARTGPGAAQELDRSPGISIPSAHSPLSHYGRDHGGCDYGRDCGCGRVAMGLINESPGNNIYGYGPKVEEGASPSRRAGHAAREAGRPADLARTIVYKSAACARRETR